MSLRDISISPAVSQNAYVSKGNDTFWMGSGEVELADAIDPATRVACAGQASGIAFEQAIPGPNESSEAVQVRRRDLPSSF